MDAVGVGEILPLLVSGDDGMMLMLLVGDDRVFVVFNKVLVLLLGEGVVFRVRELWRFGDVGMLSPVDIELDEDDAGAILGESDGARGDSIGGGVISEISDPELDIEIASPGDPFCSTLGLDFGRSWSSGFWGDEVGIGISDKEVRVEV